MIKNICITGASSGIGAALAEHYAAKNITLILLARNQERLQQIAKACEKKGATVITAPIDICAQAQLKNWLGEQDQKTPIDLLIANAGLSSKQAKQQGLNHGQAEHLLVDVHLHGSLNTIQVILEKMQQRQQGQIAIMSSMNALIALPHSPIYGAVKAALLHYSLSLRAALQHKNIHVNAICPGWITTPLTQLNQHQMPFLMNATKAAHKISAGLKKNKAVIAFPARMYYALKLFNLLPNIVKVWFMSKLYKKDPK